MPRLFYALWPTPAEQRHIATYAREALAGAGKAVREPDIHLTLCFLGQVGEDDAAKAMQLEPPSFQPFTVELGPAKLWPRGLAVIEASSQALMSLQREIDERLRALGLPTEARAFRPHVTLARKAQGVQLPALPTTPWAVDSFCLVESAPSGESKYTVRRRWRAL